MRYFLLGLLFSSSLAFAGSGGMVGGGKRPPVLAVWVPALDWGIEETILEFGKFTVVSPSREVWDTLQAVLEEGLELTVENGPRGQMKVEMEVVNEDLLLIRDGYGLGVYVVRARTE